MSEFDLSGTRRRTILAQPSVVGLELSFPDQPWVADALCPQVDAELFFPLKGGSTREAKKICRMCPVIDECLDYALSHDERAGIWGGLSERQRRSILRGTSERPGKRENAA